MIGIDVGATNTEIGMVNGVGDILGTAELSTRSFIEPEHFVEALTLECGRLCEEKALRAQLCAVGVGAPNGNYYMGTIEEAPNLRWKGRVHLVEMIKDRLGLPCVLTNDANAAALGEMHYGHARGMKNYISITIGTGLGSGLVVNGQLVYGHTGFAGEMGHTIAVRGGRLCTCGRYGCLETYVSARGLRQTALELLDEGGRASSLRDLPKNLFNAKAVFEAAEQGDDLAREAFAITGEILGQSLADAVAYTSPEAIFLFGGLANAGEYLLGPTRAALESNMLNIFKGTVKLLPSALNSRNAAILGAAALAKQEFYPD